MRLGMDLPFFTPSGDAPNAADVAKRARAIEAAGFDSIWMGDGYNRGIMRPDALMWLLTAGVVTERAELIVAVLQLPLRSPMESAVRMLTLHALTGGRFSAGVGAGSTKDDFDGAGLDFTSRFKTFGESLSAIRRLCKGEQVGAGNLHPWPSTLGGPPILIGSWAGGLWIKRAAQEYDGWITSGMKTNFRTLREGIQRYRHLGGKRAIVSSMFVDFSQPNADISDDEPFTFRCGPESAFERYQRLVELGYDDVLIGLALDHAEHDNLEEELAAIRRVFRPD